MPKPRFAVVGDSLSQGFMSGAICRTELSYPTMVARALGLRLHHDFRVPFFPGDGLPVNIEAFLRHVARHVGADISLTEWVLEMPRLLYDYLDQIEDLYELERHQGARQPGFAGLFHNLAVWGFTVQEAQSLTTRLCDQAVAEQEGWIGDDFLAAPSAPMYRTAKRVLNPADRPERRDDSMLDALARLVHEEDGLDLVIVWLGANDALGTVLELELHDLADHKGPVPTSPLERRRWNLTSSDRFRHDYRSLAERIDEIVGETPVFVGTVPHVTIPPVTTGIRPLRNEYFKYYSRFFFDQKSFNPLLHSHLTRREARLIDRRIDSFNEAIHESAAARRNWHLVDACAALDTLAVRRNRHRDPGAALLDYYRDQPDHPLLALDPLPSILMLATDEPGQRRRGGLMSLDGVHPSTIGYGILAELFLTSMQRAGVSGADPARLDWPLILAQDALLQSPPSTWDDVSEAASHNSTLWDLVFRLIW